MDSGEIVAYPAGMRVGEALDDFLSRHGFSRDEYSAKWYWVELFGRKLWLPNPPSRRVMVPLHDLHHLATAYGTDLRGEAEIGAWELTAGCTTPTLWIINTMAALIGLAIAPRRTLRAFRAGRGSRTLYAMDADYAELLEITIGELRRRLGTAPGGANPREGDSAPISPHREPP